MHKAFKKVPSIVNPINDLVLKQNNIKMSEYYLDYCTSSLSFGFWTSLLAGSLDKIMWSTIMQALNLPKGTQRKEVARVFNEIRKDIRNRLFHHETMIVSWGCIAKNRGRLETLLKAAEMISPDVYAYVRRRERLSTALAHIEEAALRQGYDNP